MKFREYQPQLFVVDIKHLTHSAVNCTNCPESVVSTAECSLTDAA